MNQLQYRFRVHLHAVTANRGWVGTTLGGIWSTCSSLSACKWTPRHLQVHVYIYIVYRLGLMYLLHMYPTELHTYTCIHVHVPRKVYQTTQSEDSPYNQATSIYNVIHTKALGVSGTGRFHVVNRRCTKV